MPIARFLRILVALLIVVAGVGCDYEPPVPPGGRQWVFLVTNRSSLAASFAVAELRPHGPGLVVGTVSPAAVPPGATINVTFGVPPGDGWAIFVNPRPDIGPLLIPTDMDDVIRIEIDRDGMPSWWSDR